MRVALSSLHICRDSPKTSSVLDEKLVDSESPVRSIEATVLMKQLREVVAVVAGVLNWGFLGAAALISLVRSKRSARSSWRIEAYQITLHRANSRRRVRDSTLRSFGCFYDWAQVHLTNHQS